MSNVDDSHVKANVEVIREYLTSEFKGFEVTEKKDVPVSYMFAATKSADERYQLKIFWPQLSDKSNTPERTKKRLVTDDVAGRMKGKSQGEYFLWGKHRSRIAQRLNVPKRTPRLFSRRGLAERPF
jgi:hypothetical protein